MDYREKYERRQLLLDFFSANLVLIAQLDHEYTDDSKRLICQIIEKGHYKSLMEGWRITELPNPTGPLDVTDYLPDTLEDRLNMLRDMVLLSKLIDNTNSTYGFIESIAMRMNIDNNQFSSIFNSVDINKDINYCHHLNVDVDKLYDIVFSLFSWDFATNSFSLYNVGVSKLKERLKNKLVCFMPLLV